MCSHELLIISKKEPFYFECQKLFQARRRQYLNLSLMFTGVMEISVLNNTKRRMQKEMWPLAVRQAGGSTRHWHGMARSHQSKGQLLRDQRSKTGVRLRNILDSLWPCWDGCTKGENSSKLIKCQDQSEHYLNRMILI